ncbi:hypothetical protein FA13DRAFT_1725581 [Coprinellus micaceus]|uniref:Uncharacterized protein n=1 Tax=Coprinellus micaceus TaxID=71717 RepID=A0A4Y7TUV1_COPMI|nr:hypothetical protein FA13DRAFT_1725581 [Coprinellus micaceus]
MKLVASTVEAIRGFGAQAKAVLDASVKVVEMRMPLYFVALLYLLSSQYMCIAAKRTYEAVFTRSNTPSSSFEKTCQVRLFYSFLDESMRRCHRINSKPPSPIRSGRFAAHFHAIWRCDPPRHFDTIELATRAHTRGIQLVANRFSTWHVHPFSRKKSESI